MGTVFVEIGWQTVFLLFTIFFLWVYCFWRAGLFTTGPRELRKAVVERNSRIADADPQWRRAYLAGWRLGLYGRQSDIPFFGDVKLRMAACTGSRDGTDVRERLLAIGWDPDTSKLKNETAAESV